MKPILLAALAISIPYCHVGCSTTVTRTITTDKAGRITDVTVTSKAGDPAALALAGQIATAYAPRGMVVRSEKSTSEIQRILRGRPITRQEIATPAP
jgi:hypothetical protein